MIQFITVNISGQLRTEWVGGREFLVAPLTLIVPGVLNGSQGPLLYEENEIRKNPETWNGMPLVVYHPKKDGVHVSARDPTVLNSSGIGYVYQANANGKLQAEGWFDVLNTQRVDARILTKLRKGEPIELSTGLFTRNEEKEGEYNGIPYKAIARDFRPDHVAVLPDQLGACSIEDGCGVLVNERGKLADWLKANAMSHDDLRMKLQSVLQSRFTQDDPSVWIAEVFDGFFVYHQDDKLYKLTYTKTDKQVSVGAEAPVEVMRETNFVPVGNEDPETNPKTKPVKGDVNVTDKDRTTLVDGIIANCDCWTEEDREVLNNFSEDKLKKLTASIVKSKKDETVANAARQGFEMGEVSFTFNEESNEFKAAPKKVTPDPGSRAAVPATNTATQTEEEWWAAAPPGIRDAFEAMTANQEAEKTSLIKVILANKQNTLSEDVLKGMTVPALKGIAELAKPQPTSNYGGAAGGAVFGSSSLLEDDDDPPLMPPQTVPFSDTGAEAKIA